MYLVGYLRRANYGTPPSDACIGTPLRVPAHVDPKLTMEVTMIYRSLLQRIASITLLFVVSSLSLFSQGGPELLFPVDEILESTEVTFTWENTGQGLYMIEVRGDVSIDSVSIDPTILLNLPVGSYRWRARGVDVTGGGEWSGWASFSIRDPLPVPIDLTPNDDTLLAGSISFNWESSWNGSYDWELEGDETDSDQTLRRIYKRDLSAGEYRWRVRATSDDVGGAWSEWATFTVRDSLPGVTLLSPELNAILPAGETEFIWSSEWTGQFAWELEGTSSASAETGDTANTSPLVTGSYRWRVRAIDGKFSGEWSEWRDFSVLDPLPDVTLISPLDDTLTAGEVEFFWDSDWEKVHDWELIGDTTRMERVEGLNFLATVDTGTYRWRVRAWDDSFTGAWSEMGSLTIVPVADLPVVTPLAPLNKTVGVGTIRLLWTATWRQSFVVELRGDTTMTSTIAAYALEVDLPNEGEYEWRVRAIDGADRGPWTKWWKFSTSKDITSVEEDLQLDLDLDLR